MAQPGIAQLKVWFFTAVSTMNRFLSGNKPDQSTFQNLLSSVPFKLESQDSADTGQTQQGLVAIALYGDINTPVATKTIAGVGTVSIVVNPTQLPTVALTGGSVGITAATSSAGIIYTLPAYLISNMGDVLLTSLSNGQILVYVSSAGKWENKGIYNQTIDSNLTPVTQRPILNFGTEFTLTDDSGNTCTTVHIETGGITYAMMQVTSQTSLLGNTGGGGAVGEITVSAQLTLSGGVLGIANNGIPYAKLQISTGTHVLVGNPTGAQATLSEITLGSSLVFSGTTLNVNTNGVTYSKIQQTSGGVVILGNFSGSAGNVGEIVPVGFYTAGGNLQNNWLKSISAATYTVLLADFTSGAILGFTHTGAGAVTVTMPNPATIPAGVPLPIKDLAGGAGTNNITIGPYGSEKIDGSSSLVLSANYAKTHLITDQTNWFTV